MSQKSRPFDRSLVEGPVLPAVWKLAWPTMLQNMVAGLQGLVDHALVGHLVGYTGNAAIGVSWQIFLVVVVFISSLFTGMGVMVARFAGAGEPDKVNRVVFHAFLAAVVLACGVLAPLGYLLAPGLLDLVEASPEVAAEALPYLRILFVFSAGQLLFFMLGGALRSAGDPKTPLRLGLGLTVLNLVASVVLIRGLGPIPSFGTRGAAMGTVLSAGTVSLIGLALLIRGRLVVRFPRPLPRRPEWGIVKSLFRFGLPAGIQGVVMNVGGILLLRFVGSLPQSAEAQAAYTLGYTQLFSLVAWTSVGLMGASAAAAGQSLGAGKPERARRVVMAAAGIGLLVAAALGTVFALFPSRLLSLFGVSDPVVLDLGVDLLRVLSVSGLFVTVALAFTGGLQGTGDTRSPLWISLVAQLALPVGICVLVDLGPGLEAWHIWLAILAGHAARAGLSFSAFRQGRWAEIRVTIEERDGDGT